jgi:hypothetical protein
MRNRLSTERGRPRRGAVSVGTLALLAVAMGCATVVAGHRANIRRADAMNLAIDAGTVSGTDTAPDYAPMVEQALGGLKVSNAEGKTVALVTKGEPSILMISSVSCSWCKRALKDLGELSEGRPLPRLKLLTLEGAAGGGPMLEKERLTGVQLIGPLTRGDRVLSTLQFRGTPTFVAIDRNGRVVATMPGYPMREVMKTWYAVMAGDADVP